MNLRAVIRIPLFLLLLGAGAVRGAVEDLSALARLPVQEGGRVMPLDTYARLKLLQISGKSSAGGRPAVDWLAGLLFRREPGDGEAVILVNHPEVLEALGVEEGNGRRYSLDQLAGGLDQLSELAQAAARREESERSPVEKEFIRLQQGVTTYMSLRHAFQFAVPHPDFSVSNAALRARLQVPEGVTNLSFLEVYDRASGFASEVQALADADPATWTAEQAELFRLSNALFQWSRFYRDLPIPLLPLAGHVGEAWVSPWDLLAVGRPEAALRGDLLALQDLARAYAEGRPAEFNRSARAVEESVLSRAPASRSLRHLDLELRYNRLDPFYRAELFYGASFLVCLLALLTGRRLIRRLALA